MLAGPARLRPMQQLVAVIGTTGVGKSQLAVELALALQQRGSHAEILNADSMQIYKGLDVITNKSTTDEMRGIKHHLMGFLSPGQEYRVGQFQTDALDRIFKLHASKRLPIAVGGTTYYIQNLIFPNQLVSDVPPPTRPDSPPLTFVTRETSIPKTHSDVAHFPPSLLAAIDALPPALLALFYALPALPQTSTPAFFPPNFPVELLPPECQSPETFVTSCYALLKLLDPDSAARWHWRDVRKVRRGVEVVWQGRRWEDVVSEQTAKDEGTSRFQTLIFWLYAEPEVLKPRLDERVDRMLERGLLDEISGLWSDAQEAAAAGNPTNYSVGIYQAIGYKEFEPYLSARAKNGEPIDPSDPLFVAGLERMKLSTRQYSKKQVQWIKRQLIPAAGRLDDPSDVTIVLLDATDLTNWEESVRDPAVKLLFTFLSGSPLPNPRTLSATAATHLSHPTESATASLKATCEACTTDAEQPFLVEERQLAKHVASKAHRRSVLIKGGYKKLTGDPRIALAAALPQDLE